MFFRYCSVAYMYFKTDMQQITDDSTPASVLLPSLPHITMVRGGGRNVCFHLITASTPRACLHILKTH